LIYSYFSKFLSKIGIVSNYLRYASMSSLGSRIN